MPLQIEPVRNARYQHWMQTNSHAIRNRNILVPLCGHGLAGFRGQVYPCSPGTVFFFDAIDSHDEGYPDFAGRLEHLWISLFATRLLVRNVVVSPGHHGDRPRWRMVLPDAAIGISMERIWSSLTEDPRPSADVARVRLISALAVVLSHVVQRDSIGGAKEQGPNPRVAIETVCEHLHATAGAGDDLDSLSRLAGYSKFHFLRLFTKHTGYTVLEYINSRRLHLTRRMLAEGHTRKSTARALGFSDPSAFSRWVRTVKPPGQEPSP